MATDIIAIIGHKLTLSEIVNLPKEIDDWTELKNLYVEYEKHKLEFGYTKLKLIEQTQKKSNWDIDVNESVILDFWKSNENPQDDSLLYLHCYLNTFFGWLKVYRHSIQITLLPEHKYINFFYFNSCKFILEFNRAIAKRFGQSVIIYAADNGFGSYIIEEKAIEGFNFESLLEFGKKKFVNPSNSIVDKIKNMFFIDEISNNIEHFQDLSWTDIEKQI